METIMKSKEFQNQREWHKCFLVIPRVVENRLVWLQNVSRRWDDNASSVGDFSGYSFAVGGWKYRL